MRNIDLRYEPRSRSFSTDRSETITFNLKKMPMKFQLNSAPCAFAGQARNPRVLETVKILLNLLVIQLEICLGAAVGFGFYLLSFRMGFFSTTLKLVSK